MQGSQIYPRQYDGRFEEIHRVRPDVDLCRGHKFIHDSMKDFLKNANGWTCAGVIKEVTNLSTIT